MDTTPSEPYVKCGNCSFESKGFDEFRAQQLFEDHYCPRPPGQQRRWHESVMGPLAVVLIIAICTAGIVLLAFADR